MNISANIQIETANSLRSPSPYHLVPRGTDTTQVDTARRVSVLKTLYTSPYRDRKERNPDRVTGTCEWFVAHECFQQWRESPLSSMLLVSADPGCGKSVLARYLVDSELPTTESRTTCYFFFKDDFKDQRSARSALCCILHQLFKQQRMLLSDDIVERFKICGENIRGSFVELWDILVMASQDKNAGEVVCILDAFDECAEQGQSEFIRYLKQFYGTRNSLNSNLKFLLTSRPYGHIKRGFQPLKIPGVPVIHLSGENETEMSKISKEIDIYIKARVRSIRDSLKLKPSEENLLLQELLRIPHRTYLWAHLTLDLVANDINTDTTLINVVISRLPRTVDEAYEKILAKSTSIKQARKLLHIVVAATRPLTLLEMNIALTVCRNHRSYKGLNLKLEERFREYVRDLCGLFVAIIDSKIYLLHQTAKEFLVQDGREDRRVSNKNQFKWKSSLRTRDSHRILSHICIRHLRFIEFENDPLDNGRSISEYLHCYNFLDYSAKNWAGHFQISQIDNYAVVKSVRQICNTHLRRSQTWFKIYWQSAHGDSPRNFTALMIASYFGFGLLVKILLKESRAELNWKDGTYRRSALSWASENGYDDVVKLLLKGHRTHLKFVTKLSPAKLVKLDTRDSFGRTPLSYAARSGHISIVQRLVKIGARVDSDDDVGGTPLSYAICNGQKTLISLLLGEGHRVDSGSSVLQPLLSSAVMEGDYTTAKLLLESGKVHPGLKDCLGDTPLSLATEFHEESIVKLLLESSKVNPNLKYDPYGNTPLSRAAANGDGAIVKLLLKSNEVDPNVQDNSGQTPIFLAATSFEDIGNQCLRAGRT